MTMTAPVVSDLHSQGDIEELLKNLDADMESFTVCGLECDELREAPGGRPLLDPKLSLIFGFMFVGVTMVV